MSIDFFGKKEWLFSLILAIFTYCWVSFFSYNFIGTILSVLLLLFLFFSYVNNSSLFIFYVLLSVFLVPEYPRDILFSYDALYTGERIYNTFNSVKLGPLTTFQCLILISAVYYVLMYGRKVKIALSGVVVFLLIVSLLISSTLVNLDDFNFSVFNTNLKIYILGFAFLVSIFKFDREIIENNLRLFLVFYPIIAGFRLVFFVFGDLLFESSLSFDYFTQPIVSVIGIIYLSQKSRGNIFDRSFLYRCVCYISLISASRAVIAITFILLLVLFVLRRKNKNGVKRKMVTEVVPIFASLVISLSAYSPDFYNFLLWKVSDFDFFSQEHKLSGSGQVRNYEVINIIDGEGSSIYNLLLGRGLSGYFNFEKHIPPIDEKLDSKSFSDQELMSNKYRYPHSFIAANMLKGGAVLLVLYLFLHVFIGCYYIMVKNYEFATLSFILIYNSYVRVEFFLLFICLISIYLMRKRP